MRRYTSSELQVQIHVEGLGQLGRMQYSSANPFPFTATFPIPSLAALAEIDRQMPIPCFAMQGLPERLFDAAPEDRAVEFAAVSAALAEHKPSVTSVMLRLAAANGQDYREEFLGCLPIGKHFAAPQVTGGKISQDELERLWESGGEHFKLTTLFREDTPTLAAQIREWMRDPSQPFPFEYDNDLQFHYCKSRMEREHLRHIDRFWYIERPVVFRFCPVTKAEQYRVELEYWRSKGDERRAGLLEELMAEAEVQAEIPREQAEVDAEQPHGCPASNE